ncbi:MAG: energy transducer TonB [Bacteroidales bacterium]|nr:energy transducer TonB [Bacteroidales bacterium]
MKRFFALLLLLAGPAALAQPKHLTVKEFLRLSQKDTTSYAVSGVVTRTGSSARGSFYIKDRTGTLYVYGIKDPADPARSFRDMDIVQGDTVTVLGRFTIYNETTKEMKDGRLLSKSDGPDHDKPLKDRLERKPSFKGKSGDEGLDAFRQWVQARIVPPADGAKGKVQVRFVVGRNGGVQEVQIAKGASSSLNEEALRVVKSSPKWKPAVMDGNPIRTNCYVTVTFE